jgi:signal transduction histidine kinase
MPHVAELRSMSNVVFGVGLYGLAWLVGRVLHRLEDRDRQLRAALEQLAAEQALREQAVVASERSRIAGEMHDVVAHAVTLMVVQVGAARMKLAEAAPPELRAAEDTGRQALVELRRTLGLLGRTAFDTREPLPGFAALDALAARCRDAGLDLDVEYDALGALPDSVQLAAYRVIQESLTNVLRHAGTVATSVRMFHEDDRLIIEVVNAPGRPVRPAPPGGHGLQAMRERAALFGGTLEAGRRDDGGFRVRVELPVVDEDTPAEARARRTPEGVG